MTPATVIFVLRDNRVLLARKTKKPGAGKWNGYGGKQDGNESLRACAVRELFEESGGLVVKEEDLIPRARIRFYNYGNDKDIPNFEVVFYVAEKFSGNPKSTEEMMDPQWFSFDTVPYDEMLAPDKIFVPMILRGDRFRGTVHFNHDMTRVERHSFILDSEGSLEI